MRFAADYNSKNNKPQQAQLDPLKPTTAAPAKTAPDPFFLSVALAQDTAAIVDKHAVHLI